MGKKILVVDDEERLRTLVRDFFRRSGYVVLEAGDGLEALERLDRHRDIGLVILDVMMPRLDGWDTAREIRKSSSIPIIMLTAKSDESDELRGFELGIDEYVTKPFSPRTLVARAEALLRRTGNGESGSGRLETAGIVVDQNAHTAAVDGRAIELSLKEFELLTYFMENSGIALSREQILNNVWNYDYFGDPRTVDTHVKKLRSKMGEKGELIQTIWGMGYRFTEPKPPA